MVGESTFDNVLQLETWPCLSLSFNHLQHSSQFVLQGFNVKYGWNIPPTNPFSLLSRAGETTHFLVGSSNLIVHVLVLFGVSILLVHTISLPLSCVPKLPSQDIYQRVRSLLFVDSSSSWNVLLSFVFHSPSVPFVCLVSALSSFLMICKGSKWSSSVSAAPVVEQSTYMCAWGEMVGKI